MKDYKKIAILLSIFSVEYNLVASEIFSSQSTDSQKTAVLTQAGGTKSVLLFGRQRMSGGKRSAEESKSTDGDVPISSLEMRGPDNSADRQRRIEEKHKQIDLQQGVLNHQFVQFMSSAHGNECKHWLDQYGAGVARQDQLKQELEAEKFTMDEFFGPNGTGPATKIVIGDYTDVRAESPSSAHEEAEQRAVIQYVQRQAQQQRARREAERLKREQEQAELQRLSLVVQQATQAHADCRKRMGEDQAWNDQKRWDELGQLADRVQHTQAALFNFQRAGNQRVAACAAVVSTTQHRNQLFADTRGGDPFGVKY